MSTNNGRNNRQQVRTRKNILIAISALSCLLVILIVVAVVLPLLGTGNKQTNGQNDQPLNVQSSPTDGEETLTQPDSGDNTTDNSDGDDIPTEKNSILLTQGLYVVHIGNFSGRYVEDGSDAQIENVCAAIVENRGDKTLQLIQFQIICGDETYDFSLTTLPPGERAILQELNKKSLDQTESIMNSQVGVCVFFDQEPSLYEDVFAVSGADNSIELRNLTDSDIPGPIYVYYKTRTAEGYAGGITYRLTIPGIAAGGSYQAIASHFWPGSSQVMFIDYAK